MTGSGFIGYFLAGAIPRLSMFAILFLLPRRISMTETGLFVLAMTVGEILEMTSANWVRLFAQSREAGQRRLRPLRFGRLLVLAGAMLGIALVLSIPVAWFVASDHIGAFIVAVFAYVLAFAPLRLVLVIQQVTHNSGLYAKIELTRGLMILPAVIGATYLPNAGFLAPSLALSGITLLAALVGFAASRSQFSAPRLIARGYRTPFQFGMPIVGDTLLNFVVVNFERFVLNAFLGPASVGVYAIAFALGRQTVEFFIAPLNTMTVPVLFATRAREGDERAREIQSGISISIFILCAGALAGIILLRSQIADLFVKPEFRADTAWLMPVIAGSTCLLMFKVFLYDNLFFMLGRNALKLKAVVPAAIVSAFGSVILVHAYGLPGAALSALLSTTLALCASIFATRTFFRFRLPLLEFGKITLIVLAASVALVLGVRVVAGAGSLAEFLAGFIAFSLAYGGGLAMLGISPLRLLKTPWEPYGVPVRQTISTRQATV
ncbi:MAG: lipopolysaccharide biosynthesis protein [Proteobacteria bacterium]|nr:lipopolysaccharide biosynthesis protein [Pseudomonadota bacterium]